MDDLLLTVVLKPILMPLLLLVLFAPAVCVRVLVQRKMRDGKLKRFLLRKSQ